MPYAPNYESYKDFDNAEKTNKKKKPNYRKSAIDAGSKPASNLIATNAIVRPKF